MHIKKYNYTEKPHIVSVLWSVKLLAVWEAVSPYCSTCRWCHLLFYNVAKTFFSTKHSVSLKIVKNYFSKYFNFYILEVFNTTIFSSQLPDCTGKLTCEFSRSLVGCRLLSAPSSVENEIWLEKMGTERLENKIYFRRFLILYFIWWKNKSKNGAWKLDN